MVAAQRGSAIARTGIDPATNAPPAYRVTPLDGLGGIYPISQRTGSYMARLDHEISPSQRLSGRLSYAHDRLSSFEAQNNDQISGLLAFQRTAALTSLDPTAVVTLNSGFGPQTLNDLRFSVSQRKFDMTPNSLGAPVNIPGIAFLGRENILPHYRKEKHFHVDDTLTRSAGAHTFKAGGDLMLCPSTVDRRLTNGLFTFAGQAAPGAPAGSPALTAVQAYGLGLASNFVQQFGDPLADAGKLSAGVFAQDSWRLRPRLTLDLGLRYDVERADERAPGTNAMQPVFSKLSLRRSPPTDRNNLQPRVGFAYQVLGGGRLTIRGSYGIFYDRLLNLATYLAAVGDGAQITRVILPGAAAAAVFQSPAQKLAAYPGGDPPTGLIAFSSGWQLGNTQQANLLLSSQVKSGLTLDADYVWVRGTHLPRSRDVNPTDSARAAAFLAAGNAQPALLRLNFFRAAAEVSEAMAFEGSAASTYHGLRLALRGQVSPALSVNASYTLSKAIDDAEEIFPHTRAQDMRDFRSERGLALYDQRQRFVLAAIYRMSGLSGTAGRALNGWSAAPYLDLGSGRPVNVLLGSDNNLDQEPGSDRPDVVPGGDAWQFRHPLRSLRRSPSGAWRQPGAQRLRRTRLCVVQPAPSAGLPHCRAAPLPAHHGGVQPLQSNEREDGQPELPARRGAAFGLRPETDPIRAAPAVLIHTMFKRRDSMKTLTRAITSILVIAILLALAAGPASAQAGSKQKVVVHLTHYTDNLHAVKMAVHLAYMMQTMGAEVTMLLDLEGVRLADTRQPGELVWGKGEPISKELAAFVKAGGKMLLCPHCSEHTGLTAASLRPGARIGQHGELAKIILAADKVLDY